MARSFETFNMWDAAQASSVRRRLLGLVSSLHGLPKGLVDDQVIMIDAGEYQVALEILLDQISDWGIVCDEGQQDELHSLSRLLQVSG